MLTIKNLTVLFDERVILESIDLETEPGSIYSIAGPNGAGKSTLLRALTGLITDYDGRMMHEGRDLSNMHSKSRARVIAYLPQSLPGNQHFRVHEFVTFGNYPWDGLDDPCKVEERIENALQMCGIEEFRNRKISTLSGGERQRVYLAQVIAQNTPVILLDEPTVFLDLKHQILFENILLKLKDQNKILLYVSHDLHSARRIATSFAAFKNGRILEQGHPDSVLNAELIGELFDIDAEIIRQWYGNGLC